MRILAVDPGDKNIGIAISDPTGTFAQPLKIIQHTNRKQDAKNISTTALDNDVELIVVGQALNLEGQPSLSGRKAARLAGAIRSQTDIPVKLWDESGSTKKAKKIILEAGLPRKKRKGHHDTLAAVIILQSFLDSHGGIVGKGPE